VRHTTSVRRTFQAEHLVTGHSRCGGWRHGHRWAITVTLGGGLDPKNIMVVDHGVFRAALDRIVDEFADRDLNDMLPAIVTTPEGIGLYVIERLILDWPTLTGITVDMGDRVSVHVEIELR
jgi:6-pyruvoyl-tetrahydropterin synthase